MKLNFRIITIVCVALMLGWTGLAQAQSNNAKTTVPIFSLLLLNEGAKILDLQLYKQEQTEWCWAATAQMIMEYHTGVKNSQCEMANFVRDYTTCCTNPGSSTCNYPTYRSENVYLYEGYGYNCTDIATYLSFSQVQGQINAHRPFWWGWYWYGGGGHAMAVKGYDASTNYVYYNDPWDPQSKVCVYDSCVYTYQDHSWGATIYDIYE